MARRAARLDGNHAEAVRDLESNGWSVLRLLSNESGVPDVVAARDGFACLLEIKNGKSGRLSEDQRKFINRWPGMCAVVHDASHAHTTAEKLKDIYDMRRNFIL